MAWRAWASLVDTWSARARVKHRSMGSRTDRRSRAAPTSRDSVPVVRVRRRAATNRPTWPLAHCAQAESAGATHGHLSEVADSSLRESKLMMRRARGVSWIDVRYCYPEIILPTSHEMNKRWRKRGYRVHQIGRWSNLCRKSALMVTSNTQTHIKSRPKDSISKQDVASVRIGV